jgi:hypothetical protein
VDVATHKKKYAKYISPLSFFIRSSSSRMTRGADIHAMLKPFNDDALRQFILTSHLPIATKELFVVNDTTGTTQMCDANTLRMTVANSLARFEKTCRRLAR